MAGRSHDVVKDISDLNTSGLEFRDRKEPLESLVDLKTDYTTLYVAVQPTINCLQAGFLIKRSGSGSVLLGPSTLTKTLFGALSSIHCSHRDQRQPLKLDVGDDSAQQLNGESAQTIWVSKGNFLSKLVALQQCLYRSEPFYCICRRDGCRGCCIRAAKSKGTILILV